MHIVLEVTPVLSFINYIIHEGINLCSGLTWKFVTLTLRERIAKKSFKLILPDIWNDSIFQTNSPIYFVFKHKKLSNAVTGFNCEKYTDFNHPWKLSDG